MPERFFKSSLRGAKRHGNPGAARKILKKDLSEAIKNLQCLRDVQLFNRRASLIEEGYQG